MKLYDVYDLDNHRIGERLRAAEVKELCGIDSSHLSAQAKAGRVYQHKYRFVAVEDWTPSKKEPKQDWSGTWKADWDRARKKLLGRQSRRIRQEGGGTGGCSRIPETEKPDVPGVQPEPKRL